MADQPEQLDQLTDDELDAVAGGGEGDQTRIYEDGRTYDQADISQI